MDSCFHCALPLPSSERMPTLPVLGSERQFCCPGCHAVCETIVEAGLDDYYRYRSTAEVGSARQDSAAALLERLAIYDRPEIQKSFVPQLRLTSGARRSEHFSTGSLFRSCDFRHRGTCDH